MGECVAMMNCAPVFTRSWMRASAERCALRRPCGLGLVEQIQTARAEAAHHQRHEGLAVGLLMQWRSTVVIGQTRPDAFCIEFFDLGGDVVKTLRAQEVALFHAGEALVDDQIVVQCRVRGARLKRKLRDPPSA